MKSTEQLATPVETCDKVQLGAEKVPPPLTSVAQLSTVPVGVDAPLELVSVTVAVHVVVAFTATDDGAHDTEVEVACFDGTAVTVTEFELPLLASLYALFPVSLGTRCHLNRYVPAAVGVYEAERFPELFVVPVWPVGLKVEPPSVEYSSFTVCPLSVPPNGVQPEPLVGSENVPVTVTVAPSVIDDGLAVPTLSDVQIPRASVNVPVSLIGFPFTSTDVAVYV